MQGFGLGVGLGVGMGVAASAAALVGWMALNSGAPRPMAEASAEVSPTVIARAAPLTSRLAVVGVIELGRTMNVIAPFAGTVKEKRVDPGARVERGQTLLILDTFDVDMRLRDAETALIKASQRVDEVRNWSGGAEMSRARRQTAQAERDADQARRRVTEAKPLIDLGIIPRQEYEDLRRQAETQAANLAAAREELAVTLKRGGADAARMAELELAGAKAKVGELTEQRERATVTAPVSGVVLKAPSTPASGQAGSAALEVGGALFANQILFMLADLETLAVSARVDEMDINRLHLGQPVDVTGEAFPAGLPRGQITAIAHQATAADSGSPAASFAIRVDLPPLTDEMRRHVRVGMSATLSITVHESASSIVVPHNAVRRRSSGPFVTIRDPATGVEKAVSVTVGEATDVGLEIRAGLREGDTVVVGSSAR